MPGLSGLVVTGGAAPRQPCTLIDPAAWLVVAADSGLEHALALGITPHHIVGDMDSLADDTLLSYAPHAQIHRYPAAKDFTDTELALRLLWQCGVEHVTILGGGGGRIDHLLAITRLFDRSPFPNRWITDNEDIWCVDDLFQLAGARGTMISVFPVGPKKCRTRSKGLQWELTGLRWRDGDVGISNRVVADECRIEILSGRLLIIRPLLPSVVQLGHERSSNLPGP